MKKIDGGVLVYPAKVIKGVQKFHLDIAKGKYWKINYSCVPLDLHEWGNILISILVALNYLQSTQ